jgi:hypothetical protein
VQLTSSSASKGSPRWSPDGRWITFDSNAGGQWDIYVVPALGGTVRRMTFEPAEDSIPSFSGDGKFLYFTSKRSGTFEIWKVPVDGGAAVRITTNGGVVARESRDRKYLYYTTTHTAPSGLWRMPAGGGGPPEKVLDGVSARGFHVLDHGIYYIERNETDLLPSPVVQSGLGFLRSNAGARLRFFDFAQRTSTVIADLGHVAIGLAVSPDARTILFTRVESLSSDLMMVENFR